MVLDDIQRDLKEAMKARDAVRMGALRMAIAAATEKRIELKRDLSDADVFGVLQSQVKRRRDSIEQFEKAGRDDLVKKETREIEVLEAYLPRGLSDAELDAAVDEAIREAGAGSRKDTGKVMKILMDRYKGRVDGKTVNQRVLEKLS